MPLSVTYLTDGLCSVHDDLMCCDMVMLTWQLYFVLSYM